MIEIVGFSRLLRSFYSSRDYVTSSNRATEVMFIRTRLLACLSLDKHSVSSQGNMPVVIVVKLVSFYRKKGSASLAVLWHSRLNFFYYSGLIDQSSTTSNQVTYNL